MYCECYNTQLFITFKWEQILQTRSHIMMKSQHNSVLHAFSVPHWSEMCGVVGVLTVLLLLPTQYTAGEIFKMWCQEFDKYLLANIYIDIDITLLISDMDFLYQFNLRLHNFEGFFSNVEKKKKNQKLAGLWLVGEVVNHVGLYGSKVAEGCSAFQRRSCFKFYYHSLEQCSHIIMSSKEHIVKCLKIKLCDAWNYSWTKILKWILFSCGLNELNDIWCIPFNSLRPSGTYKCVSKLIYKVISGWQSILQ